MIASGIADMIRSLLAALTKAGRRVPGPRTGPRAGSAGVTTSRPRFARHATMAPRDGPPPGCLPKLRVRVDSRPKLQPSSLVRPCQPASLSIG